MTKIEEVRNWVRKQPWYSSSTVHEEMSEEALREKARKQLDDANTK